MVVLLMNFDGHAVAQLGLAFRDDVFASLEPGEDFRPCIVLEAGLDFAGNGLALFGHENDGFSAVFLF